MKTFIFYNKFDSTHEPISKIIAFDIDEAVETAAAMKQLSIDEFLTIFEVKEA